MFGVTGVWRLTVYPPCGDISSSNRVTTRTHIHWQGLVSQKLLSINLSLLFFLKISATFSIPPITTHLSNISSSVLSNSCPPPPSPSLHHSLTFLFYLFSFPSLLSVSFHQFSSCSSSISSITPLIPLHSSSPVSPLTKARFTHTSSSSSLNPIGGPTTNVSGNYG